MKLQPYTNQQDVKIPRYFVVVDTIEFLDKKQSDTSNETPSSKAPQTQSTPSAKEQTPTQDDEIPFYGFLHYKCDHIAQW